jgi:hypothetical protein
VSSGISVAQHPRAMRQVRLARAWCGIAAFALTGLASLHAGAPLAVAAERALVAGVGGLLAGWFAAVTVWRHLAVAELRAARRRALDEAEEIAQSSG